MKPLDRNPAMRRLSGTKGNVNLALPKPGENPELKTLQRKSGFPAVDKKENDISLDRGMSSLTSNSGDTSLKVPDRGATVLGMPVNKFSQLAGAMGAAFDPKSPMGRIGAFTSNLAGQEIADEARTAELEKVRSEKLTDKTEDRNYAEGITRDNREYLETVDDKKWDRGEPMRDLQQQAYQKQIDGKDAYERFEGDPEGYKKFMAANRGPVGGASAGQREFFGDDGSSFTARTPEEAAWAKENNMSPVKPGKQVDTTEALESVLGQYKGVLNEDGQPMTEMEGLTYKMERGDPIAGADYIKAMQYKGIFPKGDFEQVENSATGEKLFYDETKNVFLNSKGNRVKPKTKSKAQSAESKGH